MSVIELDQVECRLTGRTVLSDVTVRLTERRIGVIGANGSGKSTLARLLNGLVLPTIGKVTVDGLDTGKSGAAVRRRVGFVFTDPDAQIVLPTVAEDVAFGLRRAKRGEAKPDKAEVDRRVTAALARFGLDRLADAPAHLLSGGEKQLLALAAVLVTEPEVLVCDEPTTLLDLRNARQVTQLLDDLPQQVILVTHQLDQLTGYDRVLVLDEGRLVADAEPATAIARYRELIE